MDIGVPWVPARQAARLAVSTEELQWGCPPPELVCICHLLYTWPSWAWHWVSYILSPSALSTGPMTWGPWFHQCPVQTQLSDCQQVSPPSPHPAADPQLPLLHLLISPSLPVCLRVVPQSSPDVFGQAPIAKALALLLLRA